MLGTGKTKRRGDPDKYREYMKNYMQAWRARQKVKEKKPDAGNNPPV